MKQYSLGPNGGILTAMNLFATRFDQVCPPHQQAQGVVEQGFLPCSISLWFFSLAKVPMSFVGCCRSSTYAKKSASLSPSMWLLTRLVK